MTVAAAVERVMSGPRHAYDRDPTPEFPMVRLYPRIDWKLPPTEAAWIRDDGQDIHLDMIAEMTPGHSHACDGLPITVGDPNVDVCNVCKRRPSTGFDDFFGYTCNMCNITHRLRYKQRGVNPWSGKRNP